MIAEYGGALRGSASFYSEGGWVVRSPTLLIAPLPPTLSFYSAFFPRLRTAQTHHPIDKPFPDRDLVYSNRPPASSPIYGMPLAVIP